MIKKNVSINARTIGHDHPPYMIAELSANHKGSLNQALQIMEAAKAAGADAIKIQTYTADTMTIDCDKDDFVIKEGLWKGYTLHKLYHEAHTPWEWHSSLFKKAKELDITLFSTPFDATAVDFLETLDAPAYKIASFELNDLKLIQKVAATQKPLIMSTGMANQQEIADAVNAAYSAGCQELILLHCISSYPAPTEDSNLKTIPDMEERFKVLTGLSDHTLGSSTAIAATALGAVVIEKHFTISRAQGGHDSAFSQEPHEFKTLCDDSRSAWKALGHANYSQPLSEKGSRVFRRSLYAVQDISEGDVFTSENIRAIRPGYGLSPKHIGTVLGKRATVSITRGSPLDFSMIDT